MSTQSSAISAMSTPSLSKRAYEDDGEDNYGSKRHKSESNDEDGAFNSDEQPSNHGGSHYTDDDSRSEHGDRYRDQHHSEESQASSPSLSAVNSSSTTSSSTAISSSSTPSNQVHGGPRRQVNIQGAEGIIEQSYLELSATSSGGYGVDLNHYVGECRFLIPSGDVGLVIGKNGSNMKRIREESGCVGLYIERKEAGRSQQHEDRRREEDGKVLYIRGTIQQVAKAASVIAQVVAEFQHKDDGNGGGGVGGGECTLVLLIHRGYSGLILGKQGGTIKGIMNDTQTKLKMDQECLSHSTEKRLVLTGNYSRIGDALMRVLPIIFKNTLRPATLTIPFAPDSPFYAYDERKGPVMPYSHPPSSQPYFGFGGHPSGAPPSEQGFYGGPQGFSPYFPPRPQANTGSGGFRSDDRSQQSFQSRGMDDHSPRSGGQRMSGGGGGGGGGGMHEKPVAGSEGVVVQGVTIPSVCAGLVIGKGGANIKQIRMASKCDIQLDNNKNSNSPERTITITGTPENIKTAIQLITEQVEKYSGQGP